MSNTGDGSQMEFGFVPDPVDEETKEKPEAPTDKETAVSAQEEEPPPVEYTAAHWKQKCLVLLDRLELPELAEKMSLYWNPRMRSTAGRAAWPDARIELNPKLLAISMTEVERTVLHELAHLIAYHRAGKRRITAHGAEWQQACSDVGIPGERATHSLPLPSNQQQKRWRYACPECGEGFDRVRKMKRSAGCYTCCKKHNGGYYHKKFRLVATWIG